MTSLDFTIRVNTNDLYSLRAAVSTLAAALDQFSYTVTINEGGSGATYACMPGSWERANDRHLMLRGRDYVTISIPRQP